MGIGRNRKDTLMRGKRILGMIFALALLAATAVPASAFADTAGHWAEAAINQWSQEYGIINGYEDGTFRPDKPITRGAMAGIIDRVMHYQTQSEPATFSDTAGAIWEAPILKLNAAGVMLGDGGKALLWNDITRQEAVVMLGRAFGIPESEEPLPYDDAASVGNFARGYVSAMCQRGYLTDVYNNCFRPRDPITRAEFLNLVSRMVAVLYHTSGFYSEDVSGDVLVNTAGVVLQDMTISGDLVIAPGAVEAVTLNRVVIEGVIRNFSGIDPFVENVVISPEPEEDENDNDREEGNETDEEEAEPIRPEEVYTPTAVKRNQTIAYDGKEVPIYRNAAVNEFEEGDFYWEGGRLHYAGRDYRTHFGIDVSAYQNRASENNTIDWEAVREDGVDFVFVRAGFRGTGTGSLNKDVFFDENVEGAMEAGLETGIYFFAQAISVEEAIEEAEYVLELLEDHEIDGPVAYDWEMHDSSYRVYGTTPEMATACAIAFCQRIEEAGYDAMVYAGTYVRYMKYDMGALADYLSWYPEYKTTESETFYPTNYYHMDYWQYTSSCEIDGIGGRVDANIRFIAR